MDSTFGKYGESTPTINAENGENNMEHSKMLAQNHGEPIFETPPRCGGQDENESYNTGGIDISSQLHSGRQADEDEIRAKQRAQREEEESLELARALMAEEAMASYVQSMDYLRNNQDQFSEEDLAALQAVMDEDQHQHEVEINADAEEALDDEDNGDAYEFMLQLGERIGDVKSERWAQVAQQKIDELLTVEYNPEKIRSKKDLNDCDVKCLVCQEEYCKGETMRQLPCGHCFHKECVDQWLLSKDFCPYCRTTLDKE